MIDYQRVQAEMMTVETAAERKAIWDRTYDEARAMDRFLADKESAWYRTLLKQRGDFDALPWYKRIGRARP